MKYRYSAVNAGGKPPGRYRMAPAAGSVAAGVLPEEVPAHGTYGVLLFDPRWKAKRAEIVSRDGNACVICRGEDELQVHHRQYHFILVAGAFKMPWDYEDHLLITLCRSCHQRGHSKFKVPTLNL
ncbi:MAG: hypothetical protein AAGC65_01830 [Mucilaginibacter sp.]|uniref:HNH endonuclease n=1 Tax=Mucilaginibacter sp. TaxID=1882438 RepID=UPI0031A0F522